MALAADREADAVIGNLEMRRGNITSLPGYICLVILLSTGANAAQTLFEKKAVDGGFRYDFAWQDLDKKPHEFSFILNRKSVNDDYRHFKALRPSLLRMHSLRKLKESIAELDPRMGQVQILPTYQDIEFKIRSQSNDWLAETSTKLQRVYENALKEYLYQEYYIEFDGFGHNPSGQIRSFKPDHRRFVDESASSLAPVVAALTEKLPRVSARQAAEFMLPWLQTIPYNKMESRVESNGAGYLPPIKVIDRNQGDCDSKVVLMASLMKAMFPRLRIAIIYIPEHALIGLNVSHLQEDYTLDIDGLDYTLAEPVGPGMIEFADISDRSKRYIESGNYKVELLFDF